MLNLDKKIGENWDRQMFFSHATNCIIHKRKKNNNKMDFIKLKNWFSKDTVGQIYGDER